MGSLGVCRGRAGCDAAVGAVNGADSYSCAATSTQVAHIASGQRLSSQLPCAAREHTCRTRGAWFFKPARQWLRQRPLRSSVIVSDVGKGASDLVDRRIEDWRRRLIDLSHRNRLIAYKATRATTLEVASPSLHELLADPDRGVPWDFYLPPEPDEDVDDSSSEAAATVDELLLRSQDRHRARRPNEIEVTEANPKRIARILDNLAKRSNTEFQDKALRVLYIAAGFLDWHDAQRDKPISSPLVLVPVELRRESTRDPYRLFFVEDEEIVINPSLTEKLRRDAGLDVPGDWIWEDKPIGQELDEIRQAIAGTDWTVREDAAIGLFSFQKYVMYRDLLDHEAQVVRHPIVRSLAQGRLFSELTEADPIYRIPLTSMTHSSPRRRCRSSMPMPANASA